MYITNWIKMKNVITNNHGNGVVVWMYILHNEFGGFLGRVILTGDGYFFAVTDWGNFNFCWGSTGRDDFREFILNIGVDYFGDKMYSGISYTATGRKVEASCKRFAAKILPPLQEAIRIELHNEKTLGKRLERIEPVFVEYLPNQLEYGKLYISEKFETTSHLCACGCGELVVMPFKAGGWSLTKNDDGTVTMRPSVGNFEFPCKSHYYITNNKIEWL